MLTNAYKIVDYKPLYGCIFHEYLKDYSHWGYCDSDVIFGDLSKYLTDERLNTYDRIYQHGHLCIYKMCIRDRKYTYCKEYSNPIKNWFTKFFYWKGIDRIYMMFDSHTHHAIVHNIVKDCQITTPVSYTHLA